MKTKKEARGLEEIRKEVEEPKHDVIERLAQVIDTKRGLIVRIPQKIVDNYHITNGDFFRFLLIFEEKKTPIFKIEFDKEKNAKKKSRSKT